MKKNTKRALAALLALVLCLGLLPMAVMAEEASGPFTITFDANGGTFSDGNTTVELHTKNVDGQNLVDGLPTPDPVREGYTFQGWYLLSPDENPGVANINFTADATVKANWQANPNTLFLLLDPNGGTCSETRVELNADSHTVSKELPTPTREGYTFQGWYTADLSSKVDSASVFSGGETIVAKWTENTPPAKPQAPFRVDLNPDGGRISQWYGRDIPELDPDDFTEAVANNGRKDVYIDPHSGIGIDETDETGKLSGLPTAIRDGYTFLGWYTAKSGGTKVTESTVFTDNKYGESCLWARWEKIKTTVTVKFNLNYKRSPDDVPSNITVTKGNPIRLPDGKKLTPPGINKEFYAWCMMGEDGYLYPWKESTPVTTDMTLYAGWIRKGRVIKDGEAVTVSPSEAAAEKPAETAPSAETPAAPKFTDVAADSPFAKAIDWAVEKGVTNGTTPTTFAPGTTCSTGHILTFLWRSQGSPEPAAANPFKDEIPAAFQKAAVWAHEKGLVSGDTFGSAAHCTRAAAVTYMWKLAGSPEAKATSFKDVDASSGYAKAISWAVEKGVTNGTGDGSTFSPENTCTRGQIVTFLYRAYAN